MDDILKHWNPTLRKTLRRQTIRENCNGNKSLAGKALLQYAKEHPNSISGKRAKADADHLFALCEIDRQNKGLTK